jgi:hypothetical protein
VSFKTSGAEFIDTAVTNPCNSPSAPGFTNHLATPSTTGELSFGWTYMKSKTEGSILEHAREQRFCVRLYIPGLREWNVRSVPNYYSHLQQMPATIDQ